MKGALALPRLHPSDPGVVTPETRAMKILDHPDEASRNSSRSHHGLIASLPALLVLFTSATSAAPAEDQPKDAFTVAATMDWKESFSDPCTGDWKEKWFLDGEIGSVKTGADGMTLTAGPEFRNDAHHMVLWTKGSFEGDVKIEYDFTRLDQETRCVNILYIQASGSGVGPYAKDITKWGELRKVPSMETYFNQMDTYHISYAAFPNSGDAAGYIRGRRYIPEKGGIKGTELEPEYDSKGLFATGVKHHITVIKHERDLFIRIGNPEKGFYGHTKNAKHPVITEGRIGLRQMFTRSSRYANFRISTAASERPETEGSAGEK